jgi:hypothetical protein
MDGWGDSYWVLVGANGQESVAPCSLRCRVGTPSCPGAPLSEPDLWAPHPAPRDAGVPDGLRGEDTIMVPRGSGGQVVRHRLAPAAIPAPARVARGR